jgi:hypothetical protein
VVARAAHRKLPRNMSSLSQRSSSAKVAPLLVTSADRRTSPMSSRATSSPPHSPGQVTPQRRPSLGDIRRPLASDQRQRRPSLGDVRRPMTTITQRRPSLGDPRHSRVDALAALEAVPARRRSHSFERPKASPLSDRVDRASTAIQSTQSVTPVRSRSASFRRPLSSTGVTTNVTASSGCGSAARPQVRRSNSFEKPRVKSGSPSGSFMKARAPDGSELDRPATERRRSSSFERPKRNNSKSLNVLTPEHKLAASVGTPLCPGCKTLDSSARGVDADILAAASSLAASTAQAVPSTANRDHRAICSNVGSV